MKNRAKEKLAVLYSGGKDSSLALHKVLKKNYEVKYLLNMDVENRDSFMFHKPDRKLIEKQAEELGIKLITEKSEGEKDKELEDLEKLIKRVKDEVEGIVVGGVASNYQGKRIEKICKKFKLKFISPLWDYKGEDIWKELIKHKFKVILTKISCEGLGKEWLGRIINKKNFKELKNLSEKYKFRLDFEGGEAESAVLFMPGFQKEIKIQGDVNSEGKYRHFLNIKKIN